MGKKMQKETQEVAASPLLSRHPRWNHVDPSSIPFCTKSNLVWNRVKLVSNIQETLVEVQLQCAYLFIPTFRSPVFILQFCTRQQHANPGRRRGKLSYRRAEQQSDPNKRSVRKM